MAMNGDVKEDKKEHTSDQVHDFRPWTWLVAQELIVFKRCEQPLVLHKSSNAGWSVSTSSSCIHHKKSSSKQQYPTAAKQNKQQQKQTSSN